MPAIGRTNTEEILSLFDQHVVPNYRRFPVALVKGEGVFVWDSEQNRYLDFFPGWGCNLLGHCPPRLVEAVQQQVATLIHVPNTWYTPTQGIWAQLLSERSDGAQAFFCNSGTEAIEAAIKLARLHGSSQGKYKILTFRGGFHGRTLGATTATAQPQVHEGLGPLMAGFVYLPYGDLDAVEAAIDGETIAILIEPVQGEGGIRLPPQGFLPGLRELCDRHQLLLIFDEVQTGCGRTGHWFGYQYFDVQPDVLTLAKGVCGGISGGGMLCRPELAPSLRPGMHAATFGGNPIAACAGIATIQTIEQDNLLERVPTLSELFVRELTELQNQCGVITDIRAAGLMIGVELSIDGAPIVQRCLQERLLINCTQGNVLRLLPAMITTEEQALEGLQILGNVLSQAA